MRSFLKSTALALLGATAFSAISYANEGQIPSGAFGGFDHVFFIIMENKTDTDILGNTAYAPFINSYAQTVNRATNYFAVGHPSAPNYLEIVGGSNFGLTNDYWPNWPNGGCVDNAPGSTGCVGAFTPIAVAGADNPVVATATNSSQCNGEITISGAPAANNCALYNYPAAYFTPKSIAHQLVQKGMSWKSYQEGLPSVSPGVYGLNYSDGAYSNLSPVATFAPGPIQKLYAVKHNPFVYFLDIETGANPALSLNQVANFDSDNGLWADLQHPERVPNFSFIVPDQCNDMHGGVSGGTPICSAPTNTVGATATQQEEFSLLLQQGDAEVAKVITGIKNSPVWRMGRNVIVLTWDENDYTNAANRVVFLVETNYAPNGFISNTPYDHYSLLRTLEAGFGLPCLNHACDKTSLVMNDLFGFRQSH